MEENLKNKRDPTLETVKDEKLQVGPSTDNHQEEKLEIEPRREISEPEQSLEEISLEVSKPEERESLKNGTKAHALFLKFLLSLVDSHKPVQPADSSPNASINYIP